MLGRADAGVAFGSRAVNAEFWALVCEDEEWLDTEFAAIVSDAWETPVRTRSTSISAAPGGEDESSCPTFGTSRVWRTGLRPGRHWQRERGPPHPVIRVNNK